MGIRSTAKAIILHEGKVLLNPCYDKNNGTYYSLPGGGQNSYETLQEAVVRECREETGYTVILLKFAALCEEICDNRDFRRERPEYAHKMYHIFLCGISGEAPGLPTERDDFQTGTEWVPLDRLPEIRLLPKLVGDNIESILRSESPLFLGSEHIANNHG